MAGHGAQLAAARVAHREAALLQALLPEPLELRVGVDVQALALDDDVGGKGGHGGVDGPACGTKGREVAGTAKMLEQRLPRMKTKLKLSLGQTNSHGAIAEPRPILGLR